MNDRQQATSPEPPHASVQPPRLFGQDTAPAVERWLIDAYRRMSPAEKIARVQALNRLTVELALADIRRRHPDADESEVLLRLACRRHGPDLIRRAFGWDVAREGW
jgi:hypothetical protein